MCRDNEPVFRLMLLAGICVCGWIGFSAAERGGDFSEFYSAAELAGSGHMYDWGRIQALELRNGSTTIPFGRIPVYAVLLKPLTFLGYNAARMVWLLVNAAALVGFAVLWPLRRRHDAFMMLCWSCPAAVMLSMGQDTALFLFFIAAGLRLLQTKRDFAAGLVFSLCAAKFHLALGIPIFLLARRRWGALGGGLAGGLAQLAVSFAAEGWAWPSRLMQLAKISEFSPAQRRMPNLLGLTHWLPYGLGVEAVLGLLALAAVWVIARRSPLTIGATAAVTAGLLVGHHSYVYDGVLLLPACALALKLPVPEAIRSWALLVCAPIPYLLLIQAHGIWMMGQIAINGFGLSLLGLLAFHCLRPPARTLGSIPAMPWGRTAPANLR